MLIVYRIFWIVGLIALIAEMLILANPRHSAPQKVSDWQIVQEGRFKLRAPKQLRLDRDFWAILAQVSLGDEWQVVDSLTLTRGRRTGLVVTITTPRQAPSQGAFPQVQAQQPAADLNRLLRRAHDRYLAALREDFGYAEFKETQRRPVRVRGVPGVRSDYEYVLPHPIPLFNMRVRGYLITLPFSQTELIHFNAYCPPNSFGDYEKVYNQIIATIEVQAGGGAPFMGRWR